MYMAIAGSESEPAASAVRKADADVCTPVETGRLSKIAVLRFLRESGKDWPEDQTRCSEP